jgi:hypothetical protein
VQRLDLVCLDEEAAKVRAVMSAVGGKRTSQLTLAGSARDPKQTCTALRRADILLGNEAKVGDKNDQHIFRHATLLLAQTREKVHQDGGGRERGWCYR